MTLRFSSKMIFFSMAYKAHHELAPFYYRKLFLTIFFSHLTLASSFMFWARGG